MGVKQTRAASLTAAVCCFITADTERKCSIKQAEEVPKLERDMADPFNLLPGAALAFLGVHCTRIPGFFFQNAFRHLHPLRRASSNHISAEVIEVYDAEDSICSLSQLNH